jgi:hypothetical protein
VGYKVGYRANGQTGAERQAEREGLQAFGFGRAVPLCDESRPQILADEIQIRRQGEAPDLRILPGRQAKQGSRQARCCSQTDPGKC